MGNVNLIGRASLSIKRYFTRRAKAAIMLPAKGCCDSAILHDCGAPRLRHSATAAEERFDRQMAACCLSQMQMQIHLVTMPTDHLFDRVRHLVLTAPVATRVPGEIYQCRSACFDLLCLALLCLCCAPHTDNIFASSARQNVICQQITEQNVFA